MSLAGPLLVFFLAPSLMTRDGKSCEMVMNTINYLSKTRKEDTCNRGGHTR
uniref:Uncharacterized protein n=1 Tax=Arundo donax TaxID=35708 RepID=A0A0A8YYZ1_ARUDO